MGKKDRSTKKSISLRGKVTSQKKEKAFTIFEQLGEKPFNPSKSSVQKSKVAVRSRAMKITGKENVDLSACDEDRMSLSGTKQSGKKPSSNAKEDTHYWL